MSLDNSAVVPSTGVAKYDIPYSVKFSGDQWLIKTDGSGNRQKFTASFWFKRTRLGNLEEFWNCTDNLTGDFLLRFNNDNLNLYDQAGGFTTNAKYRDTASWMHCVLRIDTTQSTSSNRLRLYINGEQVTSFSAFTTPSQNANFNVGRSGYRHIFGAYWTNYPNGIRGLTHLLLSEFHLVDGQSLDPSNFGQFNKYGGWEAIEYTGSHGTNGYYHKFDNSSNLGDVEVGTNFGTVHSLSARYQFSDSPSTDFAYYNPLSRSGYSNMIPANQRCISSHPNMGVTTQVMTSGKWYAEFCCNSGSYPRIGVYDVSKDSTPSDLGANAYGWCVLNSSSRKYHNGSASAYGSFTLTGNEVVGIALDMDSGKIWFSKNGTWVGTPGSSGEAFSNVSGDIVFASGDGGGGSTQYFNSGFDSTMDGRITAGGYSDGNGYGDFKYQPPSGFLACCKRNMPDPAVIPSENFNAVTWSGNGGTQSVTGVGFQPDFVWNKVRNVARHHWLFNAVSGVNRWLQTSNTDAEGYISGKGINSFNSDGVTWVYESNNGFNTSGDNSVMWCWKANGSGSSNTNGSITTTASANPNAGFSIMTYTGNGSNGATIGHGLSQAPECVIFKSRAGSNSNFWVMGHKFTTTNNGFSDNTWLYLNKDYNTQVYSDVFNSTAPTSSVITLGTTDNVNYNGRTYIAYAWHSVEGFSKFGRYRGSASTSNGTFMNTGFRPAFVMVKALTSGQEWVIKDSGRSPFNVAKEYLYAHNTDSEGTGSRWIDFLSNGFKFRWDSGPTDNNYDYIYIAFAEVPFKYANGK